MSRDLNHDGRLIWREWHVRGAEERKAEFDNADKGKDGTVDLAEARAREKAQAFVAAGEGPPR